MRKTEKQTIFLAWRLLQNSREKLDYYKASAEEVKAAVKRFIDERGPFIIATCKLIGPITLNRLAEWSGSDYRVFRTSRISAAIKLLENNGHTVSIAAKPKKLSGVVLNYYIKPELAGQIHALELKCCLCGEMKVFTARINIAYRSEALTEAAINSKCWFCQ